MHHQVDQRPTSAIPANATSAATPRQVGYAIRRPPPPTNPPTPPCPQIAWVSPLFAVHKHVAAANGSPPTLRPVGAQDDGDRMPPQPDLFPPYGTAVTPVVNGHAPHPKPAGSPAANSDAQPILHGATGPGQLPSGRRLRRRAVAPPWDPRQLLAPSKQCCHWTESPLHGPKVTTHHKCSNNIVTRPPSIRQVRSEPICTLPEPLLLHVTARSDAMAAPPTSSLRPHPFFISQSAVVTMLGHGTQILAPEAHDTKYPVAPRSRPALMASSMRLREQRPAVVRSCRQLRW